ncbi:MAG: hypothetical protein ACLRX7_07220 [Acutalibacteraceae bacterium]
MRQRTVLGWSRQKSVEVNPSGQLEDLLDALAQKESIAYQLNAVRTCGRAGFIGQNTHSKAG